MKRAQIDTNGSRFGRGKRNSRTKCHVYLFKGKFSFSDGITFYRKDGRKRIQIDLDHKHKGEQPHKHVGYNHTGDGKMHHADRQLIKRIEKIWKEYQEK